MALIFYDDIHIGKSDAVYKVGGAMYIHPASGKVMARYIHTSSRRRPPPHLAPAQNRKVDDICGLSAPMWAHKKSRIYMCFPM